MLFTTITYILPKIVGVQVDYYYLAYMPLVLIFTFGVVITAEIMRFFQRRDQNRNGVLELQVRNENEAGLAKEAPWKERVLLQFNNICIGMVVAGCKFFWGGFLLPAATR